jgi:tetratricopeptide (TPR) repeat protein
MHLPTAIGFSPWQLQEQAIRKSVVKPVFAIVFALGCAVAAESHLTAQSQQQNQSPSSGQNSQPTDARQPARTQQQTNQNPFPEDTSSVPLMPSRDNPNLPVPSGDAARERVDLPDDDIDPVRSPEDAGATAETGETGFSSSRAGMDKILSGMDDDTTQPGNGNKKGTQSEPERQESAAKDLDVGKYYLDNKNWKAALSRFESALVLDPDNPDVYWGLAESQRHLGNFAEARANYQKVVDYDPDSRHGKDARKALKDPEIANAKASGQPSAAPQ